MRKRTPATLLNGLGIPSEEHFNMMGDMPGALKVKVLLAQGAFSAMPRHEPTNHLDLDAISWLEEFLINLKIPLLSCLTTATS